MIGSYKSRALKRFWTKGDDSAVSAEWRNKIVRFLSALDKAAVPDDMNYTGSGFHALTGDRSGTYALTVSRNWRLTFRWEDDQAVDLDLEDYHGK